jgi:molecular chaperone HtpG
VDIKLPAYFKELLEQDTKLLECVTRAFRDFGPWLEQSGMPFFPGFTDHSPRHINDVLATASSLISDKAREILSSADACIVALSILLHDCGMHLTQDGFRSLIADDTTPVCPHFDTASWQALWKDFLSEASRFNQKKLEAVFGDSTPIDTAKFDPKNLTERDLLLGGEFVRRHHARLAHEIALRGVPPFNANGLSLKYIDSELLDIAGLVARSHNMSIRSSFSYLEDRYAIREYRSIKIPYLMGLLRIADYVQVQSERANSNLLKVKELRSSISVQEWKAHFAVKHVSTRHEDPEAIFVDADPTDAKTFIKLAALFTDIQRELDQTWATLGEVYGRFVPLNNLGLTIRRIRSTFDDSAKLSRRLSFLPLKASFRSSDAELLELLVGPLYNYEPSVGVRELIQNAVDACRELANLDVDIDAAEQRPQDADIQVYLSDQGQKKIFRISDRGSGMTSDVVLNYFLVAGASFRNSDVWKEQHLDTHGRSQILRGGRFGVGALAAFLIGKRILVETRHYSVPEDGGIRFECSVGDQIIELQKAHLPIGTSISIEIDEVTWKKLAPRSSGIETSDTREYDRCTSWEAVNWYGLESPSVAIWYTGPRYNYQSEEIAGRAREKTVVFEGFRVFSEFQTWKELPNPGNYERILWSPKPLVTEESTDGGAQFKRAKRAPSLTVNGIRVGSQNSSSQDVLEISGQSNGLLVSYQRPPLAIFDPSGICPLNLQRSSINFSDLGIDDYLAAELADNFLQIVQPHLRGSESAFEYLKHIRFIENNSYLKFLEGSYSSERSLVCPFVVTAHGLQLLDPRVLDASGISSLFFLPTHKVTSSTPFPVTNLEKNEGLVLTRFGDGIAGTLSWFRAMAEGENFQWFRPRAVRSIDTMRTLSIVTTETKKLVTQPGKVRRDMLANLEWLKSDVSQCEFFQTKGQANTQQLQILRLTSFLNVSAYSGDLSLWQLKTPGASSPSFLGKRWLETFK